MSVPVEHQFYRANPLKPKPYVSYGLPFHEACTHHVMRLGLSRAYIVVSKSISTTPAFESLKSALGTDKIAGVRYGITPHTPFEDVFELASDIQSTDANIIITVGGGSVTDAVKLARLCIPNGVSSLDDVDRLFERIKADEDVEAATIPVINVPTTLSASEFTCAGGATNLHAGHKKQVTMHPSMYADIVVLDPKLSVSTPSRFWLSTGIRAVDHFVEGLYGNVAELFADMQKELGNESKEDLMKDISSALRSLLANLLKTKDDWEDENARLQTFLALKECPRAGHHGVGASHGIGHQLGPLGVGHGETSCIILPLVLQYNWRHGDEELRSRLGLAVDAFWGDERVAEVLHAAGLSRRDADLGSVVGAYIDALGLPRTLRQFNITEDQFESLAENAMMDRCTLLNPVKLDKGKVVDILRGAAGSL
ncbi:hypothetical protein G7Z17_g7231 [Cylindrodendrum hubeiense]|uniref:Alcohol dehydrogenase iron-type/glycerol dehydrogenase GldA domain-containing protein n=1 Tax=Cylindrodendrum hubeiense TaxID=595255 RepID=A0A9P5HDL4_9HYPO|nr:hypothetical protein G7Z17_g7231 [Cylindrodendrum hubeiense]